jgi:hypothetical protein
VLAGVVSSASRKIMDLFRIEVSLSKLTVLNEPIKVLLYFLIEACSYLFSNDGGDKADFYRPKFYPFAFHLQDMGGLD